MIINQPETRLTLSEGDFIVGQLFADGLLAARDRIRVARVEFALPYLRGALADAARAALNTNGKCANPTDEFLLRSALAKEPIRSATIAADGAEQHVLKTTFSDDELDLIGMGAAIASSVLRDFAADPTRDDDKFDPFEWIRWQEYGVPPDAAMEQLATESCVEVALEEAQVARGIVEAIARHLRPEEI